MGFVDKSKESSQIKQSDRFKEAALELGCDETEAAFDEKLKKVVAHKPKEPPPKPKKKAKA